MPILPPPKITPPKPAVHTVKENISNGKGNGNDWESPLDVEERGSLFQSHIPLTEHLVELPAHKIADGLKVKLKA